MSIRNQTGWYPTPWHLNVQCSITFSTICLAPSVQISAASRPVAIGYGYGRVRYIVVESIFYSAARAVYGSVSRQHTSHGSKVVYVDSRPRYDPGTYDSYCARSRNERSLHDLPLLDRQIADPPVQRSIDREQRSAHTGHRRLSYGCIDMTTFPSMRK